MADNCVSSKTLGEKCLILTNIIVLVLIIVFVNLIVKSNYGVHEAICKKQESNVMKSSSAALIANITDENFICNANLLTPYWSVTTAKCTSMIASPEYVRFGTIWYLKVGVNKWESEGVLHKIKTYKIHPSYDAETLKHNIGLLQVLQPIKESNKINFANIVKYNFARLDPLTLVGWGIFSHRAEIPENNIKVITVSVHKPEGKCNYIEGSTCLNFSRPTIQRCYPNPGYAVIKQDGLVGIGSNVEKCDLNSLQTVVKLHKYLDWISKSTN